MIVALVNNGNISAAWTDCKCTYALGSSSKTKLTNWFACLSIPNVNRRFCTAFACGDNVPTFSMSQREISDIVLMCWEVSHIFWLSFCLFSASKELLGVVFQILDNTESGRHEDDLVISLSEIKARLISITSISIDVLDFVSMVRPIMYLLSSILIWNSFVDVSEEMLDFSGSNTFWRSCVTCFM